MPKYMLQASYTADGVKGLIKDTASGRSAAVKASLKAVGGKLESMYYCFGKDDAVIIMDLPDNVAAASLAAAVGASGLVRRVGAEPRSDQGFSRVQDDLAPDRGVGRGFSPRGILADRAKSPTYGGPIFSPKATRRAA